MAKKAILHNRLILLWAKPSDKKYQSFYSSHGIFNSHDDAQNLVKYGSYFIVKGNKKRTTSTPFQHDKGLENFITPIEGEILFYVGVEYFIKGVFLHNGYSINKLKDNSQPLTKIYRNKSKLNPAKTHSLDYLFNHLPKIVDFTDFDAGQVSKNKIYRGKAPKGITSTKYKHPMHRELLSFIRFNRNAQLHTTKKIPEFRGNIDEVVELLDYIAVKACGQNLNDLSNLKSVYF